MLAKPGAAFDSDDYLFEIKWDGTRALTYVEGGEVRMMNRRERRIDERYPELVEQLAALPNGTVLDGEIVVLRDGKPDFQALQKREQARSALKIKSAARSCAARYVVFDQLIQRFNPLLEQPCERRRETASRSVSKLKSACIVMSQGITGGGIEYFAQAERMGLEGVVAKRLKSPYRPGKRTDDWIKIKRFLTVPCAIIGYVVETGTIRSLVLAAQHNGTLQHVGSVGSGLTFELSDRLLKRLAPLHRSTPLVEVNERATWVEPQLYCTIKCMEQTRSGHLRAPVFVELYDPNA